MVRLNHARPFRYVLGTLHFVANTKEHFAQPQGTTAPIHVDEAITCLEGQKRRDKKTQAAPQQGAGAQQQVKEEGSDGLQYRHGDVYRCGNCPPV
ncbi:hypothetical protein D3C73_1253880 [compost metagenome]